MPGVRREGDAALRAGGGPEVRAVPVRRRARCRARGAADGLGRGDGARGGGGVDGAGREGRAAQGAAVPAVFDPALPGGATEERENAGGSGTHEGTWRTGRTAVSGRHHCAERGSDGGHAAVCRDAASDRRALRPVVERIHAGDGQGGARRSGQAGAEESLHGGHRRRRHVHFAEVRSDVFDRGSQGRTGPLFRPGRGRHGRGEQEFGEDHRGGDRQLRAGLLRLRFEEVRLDHHLPPALRPAADSQHVSHLARQFRGLPPVFVPRAHRHAALRRAGGDGSAERAVRAGSGVGSTAAAGAGSAHREAPQAVRHRRLRSGERDRHGLAHQHRDADLLLRHQWRSAAGRGDRADQEIDRQDVWQARGIGGAEEFRRRGPDHRPAERSEDSGHCDQHDRTAAAGAGAGAGVRAERPGTDHLRRRRYAAGLRDAGGRHVPDGHRGVGEAQHRTRDPGVGREAVHPVR